MKSTKPPYAEPHVRWCGRSVNTKVGDKPYVSVYLLPNWQYVNTDTLTQKILEYYFSGLESGRVSQLIFSTHECNLLNLNLIRADKVWFVEKGKDGTSHLTSLAEFKPREDVRKGYLLGRYGAIPLLPKEEMKW